jgi:hypothetical protein
MYHKISHELKGRLALPALLPLDDHLVASRSLTCIDRRIRLLSTFFPITLTTIRPNPTLASPLSRHMSATHEPDRPSPSTSSPSSLETALLRQELELSKKAFEIERAGWGRERDLLVDRRHGLARVGGDEGGGSKEHPIGVFWDYENCSPPLTTNASALLKHLRSIFQPFGPIAFIRCYQGELFLPFDSLSRWVLLTHRSSLPPIFQTSPANPSLLRRSGLGSRRAGSK